MKVIVKLYGHLRDQLKNAKIELEVDNNTTVSELIKKVNIPEDTQLIIMVNGIHRELDYQLGDNQEVAIFPPLAGG